MLAWNFSNCISSRVLLLLCGRTEELCSEFDPGAVEVVEGSDQISCEPQTACVARTMSVKRSPPKGPTNHGPKVLASDLQCSGCKVVINELLTFLCNKVDVLPETAISEICLTAYSSDEIEEARGIAYNLLAPTKKFMRKKEGGEQKSIQDMVKLIKEFDPACMPTFVAKDLNKIPSVSFNYIDSTSFLKEIAILRNDVACIKADKLSRGETTNSVTEIKSLRTEIKEVKSIIQDLQKKSDYAGNTPLTKGDVCSPREQKQLDNAISLSSQSLAYIPHSQICGSSEKYLSSELSQHRPAALSKQSARHSHTFNSPTSREPQSAVAEQSHAPLYRDIIIGTSSAHSQELSYTQKNDRKDDSFIVVENKKRKKICNFTGTAKGSSKLRMANLTSFVYISRLNKSTIVDDVK